MGAAATKDAAASRSVYEFEVLHSSPFITSFIADVLTPSLLL
jgi:hypothetical protein